MHLRAQSILIFFLSISTTLSCAPQKQEEGTQSPQTEGIEKPYLGSSPISYSGNTLTLTASAVFQRIRDTDGLMDGDGSSERPALPIPASEFQILKSDGTLIQSGETNLNGEITAIIPKNPGSYILHINSRADNSYYKASVLNSPLEKKYYSLTHTFDITENLSSLNLGEIKALASQDFLGAAFNILYNIYLSNTFARTHVTGFTVAPKVQIYWKLGVTPAIYLNGTGGISFYVPESEGGIYSGLYILGGIEGNLCVDTDHFDNSVILHEYGHFLEHKFAKSDSPGGSHNGNKIIDPRLAWSEGFANFIQGVILNRSYYRDTFAIGCQNQKLQNLQFPLERAPSDFRDVPLLTGEGNFREMSVARMLFNTVTGPSLSGSFNTDSDSIYSNIPFNLFWSGFTSLSSSSFIGRSSHSFNYSFVNLLDSSQKVDFHNNYTYLPPGTAPLTNEKQLDRFKDWATPLSVSNSVCNDNTVYGMENGYFKFSANQPKADRTLSSSGESDILCNQNATIYWSDMFNSNDFYVYEHTGGSPTLNLEYYGQSGNTPYDLDLYIYKSDFVFLNINDIVKKSEELVGITESVSLSNLAPGRYFINIKVDRPACSRATTHYQLKLNNQFLCPPNP